MPSLVAFEFKKIVARRVTHMATLGLFVLLVLIMALNIAQQTATDAAGDVVSGPAAIALEKERAEAHAGAVTEERATEAIRAYQALLAAAEDAEAGDAEAAGDAGAGAADATTDGSADAEAAGGEAAASGTAGASAAGAPADAATNDDAPTGATANAPAGTPRPHRRRLRRAGAARLRGRQHGLSGPGHAPVDDGATSSWTAWRRA